MNDFFKSIGMSSAAFILGVLCLAKAWADIPLFLGGQAMKENRFSEALSFSETAKTRDSWNPAVEDLLGRSAYYVGVKGKQPDKLILAEAALSRFIDQVPYHAKGWLFLGLTRIARTGPTGGPSAAEWGQIKPLFDHAYRNEPGSAWMAFMTGKAILAQNVRLSPDEKREALERLRKSVLIRHPNQVSPYLNPVLVFLWSKFSDFTLLKIVTPPDVFSYAKLVTFVEQKKLWAFRNEVTPFYLQLNQYFYAQQCARADYFMQRGNPEKAILYYEKAYGANNVRTRAAAGMLIAQEQKGELPGGFETKLKLILEMPDKDLEDMLDSLQSVVEKAKDPYVKGLYSYRLENHQEAKAFLVSVPFKADNRFARAILADAYWRTGEREKAEALLRLALDQKDPDLRELYIFKMWNSPFNEEIITKIEQVATAGQEAGAWRGQGFSRAGYLDHKGRQRVYANLKPGPVILNVEMKGTPDSENIFPYIVLHIWDGDKVYHFDSAYIANRNFKTLSFRVETSGGSREIEIELMNGSAVGAGSNGPVLELGKVKNEYPNESR